LECQYECLFCFYGCCIGWKSQNTSCSRREEWASFFLWIKEHVLNFTPEVVCTDGAKYIYSGFKKAMISTAVNTVCWWHRKQNVAREDNKDKQRFKQYSLALAYAKNDEEIKQIIDSALKLALDKNVANSMLMRTLFDCADKTFITIKKFIAGTLTTSYAESINSLLRASGLDATRTVMEVLRSLRHFALKDSVPNERLYIVSETERNILEEEVLFRVTNGTLCDFRRDKITAENHCFLIFFPFSIHTSLFLFFIFIFFFQHQ